MREKVRSSKTGSHLCQGCGVRLMVGDPSKDAAWGQRLVMSEQQIRYCTEAAAEFDQLTEDAGMGRMTALEFMDWLSPSARGRYESPPEVEGAPRRNITGGVAVMQHKGVTHRDPFPLPVQGNGERHTRGLRARTG